MITEKERIEKQLLNRDDLNKYEHTIYKKVFSDLNEAYKKVFLIIYDCYHLRFINFFHKNINHYFPSLFYSELTEKFISKFLLAELNGTKEDDFYILCFEYAKKENADLQRLVKKNKNGSKSKEIRKIFEQKYLSEYLNKIEFVFFYDENVNQNFNIAEMKYYLNTKVIYDELYRVVFNSLDSLINLVELDKYIFSGYVGIDKEKNIDKIVKTLFELLNRNRHKKNLEIVPNIITPDKQDFEKLYLLLDQKNEYLFDALIEGFKQSGTSLEAEKKTTERFIIKLKNCLKIRFEFEKNLIEQLKQLTNL